MLNLTLKQAKVVKIAGGDDSRPILTGIEVKTAGADVSVTATDSYKLLNILAPAAGGDLPTELAGPKPLIITKKQIERAVQIAKIDKSEVAEIVEPRTGDETIDGDFPNWEKLKPAANRPAGDTRVNRKYLIELLQAMDAETVDINISSEAALDPVIITGETYDNHKYYAILMPLRR